MRFFFLKRPGRKEAADARYCQRAGWVSDDVAKRMDDARLELDRLLILGRAAWTRWPIDKVDLSVFSFKSESLEARQDDAIIRDEAPARDASY